MRSWGWSSRARTTGLGLLPLHCPPHSWRQGQPSTSHSLVSHPPRVTGRRRLRNRPLARVARTVRGGGRAWLWLPKTRCYVLVMPASKKPGGMTQNPPCRSDRHSELTVPCPLPMELSLTWFHLHTHSHPAKYKDLLLFTKKPHNLRNHSFHIPHFISKGIWGVCSWECQRSSAACQHHVEVVRNPHFLTPRLCGFPVMPQCLPRWQRPRGIHGIQCPSPAPPLSVIPPGVWRVQLHQSPGSSVSSTGGGGGEDGPVALALYAFQDILTFLQ